MSTELEANCTKLQHKLEQAALRATVIILAEVSNVEDLPTVAGDYLAC